MSGRAYARNAQGHLGGGSDLESIVPHRFTLAKPKCVNSAKELAIRRVIRRRCMEKNWKKLISRRHVRLEGDAAAAQTHESSGHPQDESTLSTSDSAIAAESKPSEDAPDASSDGALLADKQNEQVVQTESPAKSADVNGANATSEHGNGARRVKSEKQQPDDETMALAKRQLEELEARLKTLVDQKHAKFLQLKNILVEEARSKSGTTTTVTTTSTSAATATTTTTATAAASPVPAAAAAKKRRVEFKEPTTANTMSPRGWNAQADPTAVSPLLGSPSPAAASSTTPATISEPASSSLSTSDPNAASPSLAGSAGANSSTSE